VEASAHGAFPGRQARRDGLLGKVGKVEQDEGVALVAGQGRDRRRQLGGALAREHALGGVVGLGRGPLGRRRVLAQPPPSHGPPAGGAQGEVAPDAREPGAELRRVATPVELQPGDERSLPGDVRRRRVVGQDARTRAPAAPGGGSAARRVPARRRYGPGSPAACRQRPFVNRVACRGRNVTRMALKAAQESPVRADL
jgi:hypothetical protein